jgi:phenylpropionate dioxygenase-like ring-hydroxylating dioxygenase large terminal subunit
MSSNGGVFTVPIARRSPLNVRDDIYGPTVMRGSGLPGEVFTSEELFRQEAERVFHRSWCCVGVVSQLSEPRHACPVEFLGQPLLLVRNENGIEVFHNVCSHRGALLVGEARAFRRNQSIVCPYHSWTYSLEGKLLRTPHAGGIGVHDDPAIDRSRCGLKRIRAATWNGLIFVNLSGDACPFEEFIAPLAERTDFLSAGSLCHDAAHSRSAVLKSNWKIAVENFVESYHLPPIHRDLQRVNPMSSHYQILGGGSYAGQGGNGKDWQKTGSEHDLPTRPLGRFQDVSEYEVFWLCPNLIFGPIGNLCFVIILFPKSAAVTHEQLEFFFYGENALDSKYAPERQRQVDFLIQVNNEDIGICERVQAGRLSDGFTGGVFCERHEKSSLRVQQIIAAHVLSDANEPKKKCGEFSFEDIRHTACDERSRNIEEANG